MEKIFFIERTTRFKLAFADLFLLTDLYFSYVFTSEIVINTYQCVLHFINRKILKMKKCSIEFPDSNELRGQLSLHVNGEISLFLNAENVKDVSYSKNNNGYMIMSQFFVFFLDFETGDRLLELVKKQKMKIEFVE